MACILIADDERYLRTILCQTLERLGHQVREATNGEETIALVYQEPIDLLIIDILMPYKDGIETIVELRKSRPSLKIIAISGGGRREPEGYLETAKSFGADRTLTKPFSKDEIVKAVEELLGQEQVSPCSHAGETSHRADS